MLFKTRHPALDSEKPLLNLATVCRPKTLSPNGPDGGFRCAVWVLRGFRSTLSSNLRCSANIVPRISRSSWRVWFTDEFI